MHPIGHPRTLARVDSVGPSRLQGHGQERPNTASETQDARSGGYRIFHAYAAEGTLTPPPRRRSIPCPRTPPLRVSRLCARRHRPDASPTSETCQQAVRRCSARVDNGACRLLQAVQACGGEWNGRSQQPTITNRLSSERETPYDECYCVGGNRLPLM